MSTVAPWWTSALAKASPGRHFAQCYGDLGFLARAVAEFAASGFRQGEAVIVIATPAHWRAVARGLEASGFDVAVLAARGQLAVRDAETSLASLLVGGVPDRERFRALIGRTVEAARAAGYPCVRAFGEMVDLLRRTDVAATIRLEELWNEFLDERGISLLCGYSLDPFDPWIYRGLLQRVCSVHSDLIAVEDDARLQTAVALAYNDVFGRGSDAGALRQMFLTHYARPPSVPDTAAAILAVREFVPTAADTLVERVRHHYLAATAGLVGD